MIPLSTLPAQGNGINPTNAQVLVGVDETDADLGSLSGISTRDLSVSWSLSELDFSLTARMHGGGGVTMVVTTRDHLEVQMRFGYGTL